MGRVLVATNDNNLGLSGPEWQWHTNPPMSPVRASNVFTQNKGDRRATKFPKRCPNTLMTPRSNAKIKSPKPWVTYLWFWQHVCRENVNLMREFMYETLYLWTYAAQPQLG